MKRFFQGHPDMMFGICPDMERISFLSGHGKNLFLPPFPVAVTGLQPVHVRTKKMFMSGQLESCPDMERISLISLFPVVDTGPSGPNGRSPTFQSKPGLQARARSNNVILLGFIILCRLHLKIG
jgi:hypothetical protein